MLRVVLGFVIAPAAPALIVYAVEAIRITSPDAMKAALAVGMFGYLSAFVLGVPAYLLLRQMRCTSPVAYLAAGALIGLACYTALFLPGVVQNWEGNPDGAVLMVRNTIGFALLAVSAGSVAAVLFWNLAVRKPI